MSPLQSTTKTQWEKVRNALANPKFDFRTVSGIARETGFETADVLRLLNEYSSEVRIANSTSKKENLLYTLRNRPKSLQESFSDIITMVSSSTASSP